MFPKLMPSDIIEIFFGSDVFYGFVDSSTLQPGQRHQGSYHAHEEEVPSLDTIVPMYDDIEHHESQCYKLEPVSLGEIFHVVLPEAVMYSHST